MSRASFAFFALGAALLGGPSEGDERVRDPLSAALEDAPALSGPDASPAGPPTETAATPGPAAEPGNPLWAIPLRALSATRERPLFSPSRRPSVPVVAEAPAPAPAMAIAIRPKEPERPPLTLVGTVVSAEKRVAILFNSATRQVTQVREGAEEAGWRVRLVSARSAVVEKDDRSVTLDLPNPGEEPVTGGIGAPGGMMPDAGGVPVATPQPGIIPPGQNLGPVLR